MSERRVDVVVGARLERSFARTMQEAKSRVTALGATLKRNMADYAVRMDAIASKGQRNILLGVGGLAAIKMFANEARDFQDRFTEFVKVTSLSGKQVEEMRQWIKQFAATTPTSLEALNEILVAGGKAIDDMDQLKAYIKLVNKLAIAWDGVDAAEIGAALGKIGVNFKMLPDQMEPVADVINKLDDWAQAASAADIIEAMVRSSKVAAMSGMTPEQTAALVTAMLEGGATREVAGTMASKLISTFANAPNLPGKKVARGFETLGFTPKAAQDAFLKNPTKFLLKFTKRFSKLSKKLQFRTAADIFGAGARTTNIVGMLSNPAKLQEFLSKVQSGEALGSVSQEYARKLETAAAKEKMFRNQLRLLRIELGNHLLPIITDMIGKMTPMVKGFADWARENGPVIQSVAKLTTGFLALRVAVGAAQWAFGGLGGVLLRLGQFLAGGTLVRGMAMLGAVLAASGPPGWAVAAALAAIGTASWLVWKYWDRISVGAQGLWDGIATEVSRAWEEIADESTLTGQALAAMSTTWDDVAAAAKSAGSKLWEWIGPAESTNNELGTMYQNSNLVGRAIGNLITLIPRMANEIASFAEGLPETWDSGVAWIGDLIDGMIAGLETYWDGFVDAFKKKWDALKSSLNPFNWSWRDMFPALANAPGFTAQQALPGPRVAANPVKAQSMPPQGTSERASMELLNLIRDTSGRQVTELQAMKNYLAQPKPPVEQTFSVTNNINVNASGLDGVAQAARQGAEAGAKELAEQARASHSD